MERAQSAAARRRRRFLVEALEPRVLLSADFAGAGVVAAFDHVIDHLRDDLDFLAHSPLASAPLPLIDQIIGSGESAARAAPSLLDLIGIDVHLDGSTPDALLAGLDANHDGRVGLFEFLDARVAGIHDALHSSTSPAAVAAALGFSQSFASIVDDPTTPDVIEAIPLASLSVAVTGADASTANQAAVQVGLSVHAQLRAPLDLGVHADDFGISFPDTTLDVDARLDVGFVLGVLTSGETPRPADDVFLRADHLELRADASSSLAGATFNLGFLGLETRAGSSVALHGVIAGSLDDPTTATRLGFGADQFGTHASGTITADHAPDAFRLAADTDLGVRIGDGDAIALHVTEAATSTNTNLNALRNDLQTALHSAHLDDVLSAGVAGDRLTLSVQPTNAGDLGFSGSVSGTGSLTGSAPPLLGTDIDFVLSVGHGGPELIHAAASSTLAQLVTRLESGLSGTGVHASATAEADPALRHIVLTGPAGVDLQISRELTIQSVLSLADLEATPSAADLVHVSTPTAELSVDLHIAVRSGIAGLSRDDLRIQLGGNPFGALLDPSDPDFIARDADDPSRLALDLDFVNFGDLLNFNELNASTFLSLLRGLEGFLRDVQHSQFVSGFRIPFASAGFGDFFGFADALSRQLFFDDGGDGHADPGDVPKLLQSDGSLNFSAVQDLASLLPSVISGAHWNASSSELTLDLALSTAFHQAVAVNLDLDLDPLADLSTHSSLELTGNAALMATIGLNLSSAGSGGLTGSTSLASIRDGIDVKKQFAITVPDEARKIVGRTTADARFRIDLDGGGFQDVLVERSATADNDAIEDLVDDVNAALQARAFGSGTLADHVLAGAAGNRLTLTRTDGTPAFRLQSASSDDPAVVELGLPASAVQVNGSFTAAQDARTLVGQLSGDAHLQLRLGSAAPVAVAVTQLATATNTNISDLVVDVKDALRTAGLASSVEVSSLGNRLVFTSRTEGVAIQVTRGASDPAAELGLAASQSGNLDDLVLVSSAGDRFGVSLDSATTLQDVFDAIEAASGGVVTARLSRAGDADLAPDSAIVLEDHSFVAGTNPDLFRVELVNGSAAPAELGLFRADRTGSADVADGVIEGDALAGITLLDRFFVEHATASGSLSVSTHTSDPGDSDSIQASARLGFVEIQLDGSGSLAGGLSLGLRTPGAPSAGGRVTLGQLVDAVAAGELGSVIAPPSATLAGDFRLGVSVDSPIPGLSIGPTPLVVLQVLNPGNPFASTPAPPQFQIDTSGLDAGDLLDFRDIGFADVVHALRSLVDFLDDFDRSGLLGEKLPLIGKSVSDLVSFADDLASFADSARSNPAATLQQLEAKLEEAFGITPGGPFDIGLSLDKQGGESPALRIDLTLGSEFSEMLGVDLDLTDLPGVRSVLQGFPAGTLRFSGAAGLSASGSLSVELDLGIDLAHPGTFYVFDETGIQGNLDLAGDNLTFRAAIGPAGLFVTGGTASLAGAFEARIDPALASNGRIELLQLLANLDSAVNTSLDGALAANLPVFFPTETVSAGAITLSGNLSDLGAISVGLPALTFDVSKFSLFDNLLLAVDGLDLVLDGLQDLLDGQIGSFHLPLIGGALQGGVGFIQDLRDVFIGGLRGAVEGFADPSTNLVAQALRDLFGPLLQGDVQVDTNLDQPGVPLADLFAKWNFTIGDTLIGLGQGIDFDLGIPGLGLETSGDVELAVRWSLELGFGLDASDGFFLDISSPSELQLDVDVTTPGLAITGRLGFLQLTAAEDDDPEQTGVGATFAIDLLNRSNPGDTQLSFAELGSLGLKAGIAAEAVADLALTLSLNSDLVPGAPTVFPKLQADFDLRWGFGDRDAGVFIPLSQIGSAISEGLQEVAFRHVQLDLGSFVHDTVGPILDSVQEFTRPIQPVIDILTRPIPVISDLGGPVTLLDLAKIFGKVDTRFIETLADVISFVNSIDASSAESFLIPIRDEFVIFDSHGGTGMQPDLSSPDFSLGSMHLPTLPPIDLDAGPASSSKTITKNLSVNPTFSLPFLQDPSQILGLLLGREATLFKVDLGPLEAEFSYRQFFPIFGPLGVSIGGTVGVNIDVDFGFDTAGVRQFASSGFQNPLLIFNGFFVDDHVSDGIDHPEVTLSASITAAAELNLGIARAGVEGGIFATVFFDLFDPDHDGKVRLVEIVESIETEARFGNVLKAPFALFDISGRVEARLFAFLEIKLFIAKIRKEFPIVDPPIVLADFQVDFERPAKLAQLVDDGSGGSVLQLNAGAFAAQRLNEDTGDGAERYSVSGDPGSDTVTVRATLPSGSLREQTYSGITRIVAKLGEGDDVLDLSGMQNASIGYEIDGGPGNDRILLGAGRGVVHGGLGDDTITGGSNADVLFGEQGRDAIDGGDGDDWVFGDAGLVRDVLLRAGTETTDGADTLVGGRGADVVFGSGGDDSIAGGEGADVLLGDGGQVVFSGSTLEVTDSDHGSGGRDHVTGDAGADQIFGGAGDDQLLGGSDDDRIIGDSGSDTIDAGDGNDLVIGDRRVEGMTSLSSTTALTDGRDSILGGAGLDTLFGGGGNDSILGGAGADQIFGERGADLLHGGDDADSIHGGSDPDTLYGDAGADQLDGEQGPDLLYGDTGPGGSPLGAGADTLISSLGDDVLDGQQGSDEYRVSFSGGDAEKLVRVLESGVGDNDVLIVRGTELPDVFLLRAGPGSESLAFVAMLNGGANGAPVHLERVNYDKQVEQLEILAMGGDDDFSLDDNRAATTIEGGLGNDTFQIGQLFKSPRSVADANIADPADIFATTETTRGFVSNGISFSTTINGGAGGDVFTVFRNLAVLSLNGGAGDDTFIVRAFALVGSEERPRMDTQISGGAGADFIQYAVNAPVVIDGGDGFDTVIVVGTEFGDDFVVTRDGVFGAGLFVRFTGVEAVSLDGAEGDDRFFILSTGEQVKTVVSGGLGSDRFNVTGDAPAVVSNDLRGHSGLIGHEAQSADLRFDGLKVDGISAEIADNDEPAIALSIGDRVLRVIEGDSSGLEGFQFAAYTIVLTRPPQPGTVVRVTAAAPRPDEDDQHSGGATLRFVSANAIDGGAAAQIEFTAANWSVPQELRFEAQDDAAAEGLRFGAIQHKVETTPNDAIAGGITAVVDSDQEFAGILRPVSTLTVSGVALPAPDSLKGATLVVTSGAGAGQRRVVAANSGDTITVNRAFSQAVDASSRFEIQRFDGMPIPVVPVRIEDNDTAGVIVTQSDERTIVTESGSLVDSYQVVLSRAPLAEVVVALANADGQLALSAGELHFTPGNWFTPQSVQVAALDDSVREGLHSAFIAQSAHSADAAFDGIAVQGVAVQVGDNEVPGVLVLQSGGSTDLVEGGAHDGYDLVLTAQPTADVVIDVVPRPTPTQRSDVIATLTEQVSVAPTRLTFTPANWDVAQHVEVSAIDDGFIDGGEKQVFAPTSHVASRIQGPLFLEGAGGGGSLEGLDVDPTRLPGETNLREPTGSVLSATQTQVTVSAADLAALPADLENFTLEITDGPGKDQVRLVTASQVVGGNVVLTLHSPLDAAALPTAASKFALTATNPNFLVEEPQQVDALIVFNEDSAADDHAHLFNLPPFVNDEGATILRSRIDGLGMGPDRSIGGRLIDGGISYEDFENATLFLGSGNDTVQVDGTHSRPDFKTVTLIDAGAGDDAISVSLHDGVDGFLAVDGEQGSDRIDASGSSAPLVLFGGSGSDVLIAGTGSDVVFGDRGRVDYANEQGRVVTRLGSGAIPAPEAPDPEHPGETIVVSRQTDGVFRDPFLALSTDPGDGGSDTIVGAGGRDTVIGGAGADDITAGPDVDLILGDSGEFQFERLPVSLAPPGAPRFAPTRLDLAFTTSPEFGGDDVIRTNGGFDTVLGGSGSDQILGAGGTGGLRALAAGAAGSIAIGDNGRADFADGALVEILTTDAGFGGDDHITGSAGSDTVLGGSGNDELLVGMDRVPDLVLGDNGRALFANGVLLQISTSDPAFGGNDHIAAGDGPDTVLGGSGADDIDAGSDASPDLVLGDNGIAIFAAGLLRELRSSDFASGGDDAIDTGNGPDLVIGGAGADRIATGGDDARDIVLGDSGRATFLGSESFDAGEDASTLSLHFGADPGQTQTLVSGVAGAPGAAAANWNNLPGGGPRTFGDDDDEFLVFDDGVLAAGVTARWQTSGPGGVGGATADRHDNLNPGASNDARIFESYLTTTIDRTLQTTIGGLAPHFASYDVYVYLDAEDDDSARTSSVRRISDGTTTYFLNDPLGHTFNGSFAQVTSSSAAAPQVGNFVVFRGLTADQLTISVDDDGSSLRNQPAIAGIQIVGHHVAIDRVETLAPEIGGADSIATGGGPDLVMGGAGGDSIDSAGPAVRGATDADLVLGDSGRATFARGELIRIETTQPGIGGADSIRSGNGEDTLIGGAGSDIADAGARGPFDNGDVRVLSLNFGSEVVEGRVNGVAGALQVDHWNNLVNRVEPLRDRPDTAQGLVFADGSAAAGVQLTWGEDLDTRPSQSQLSAHADLDPQTENGRLFEGAVSAGPNDVLGVNLTGLGAHFPVYDVYVYVDLEDADVDPGNSVHRISAGDASFFLSDPLGNTFRGEFVASTSSSANAPQVGNYVVFRNVSGDRFALRIAGQDFPRNDFDGRVALSGIQVVGGTGKDAVAIGGDRDRDVLLGDGGRVRYLRGEAFEIATTDAAAGPAPASDTLQGGGGADLIAGGNGGDSLLGEGGNDHIYGDGARFVLRGDGRVVLEQLLAAAIGGNDDLIGGADDDQLHGQAGNDDYVFAGHSLGTDQLFESDGSDGAPNDAHDRLVFEHFDGPVNVQLDQSLQRVNDAVREDVNLRLVLSGPRGFEDVVGSRFDDAIGGNDRANTLEGLDGQDVLLGRAGDDLLLGGAGNDAIDGGDDSDLIDGGAGNDVIRGGDALLTRSDFDLILGGAGNDLLIGNRGNDLLDGEAGNDDLQGGLGSDLLLGGDGDDHLDGGLGDDTLEGGAGRDRIDFSLGRDTRFDDSGPGVLGLRRVFDSFQQVYSHDGFFAVDPNASIPNPVTDRPVRAWLDPFLAQVEANRPRPDSILVFDAVRGEFVDGGIS